MSILIKSAKIIDASSKFNGKTKDIFIKQGIIQEIDDKIVKKSAKEINLGNLHISQGWLDSSVCFGEPGLEERETIENGSLTACLSGFTDIILNSNTLPVIDSKADVIYVKSKNKNNSLKIHPLGALTVKSEGSEMAELHEMFDSGAVGFYDYKTSVYFHFLEHQRILSFLCLQLLLASDLYKDEAKKQIYELLYFF